MQFNPGYLLQTSRITTVMFNKCLYHMKIQNTTTISDAEYNTNSKIRIFVKQSSSASPLSQVNVKKNNTRFYSNTNHPPINDRSSSSSSSIDEFRAREEQQDQEYLKQQEMSSSSSTGRYRSDNTDNDKNLKEENIEILRYKILEASLPFVNTYGWRRKTIVFGAESIGYPGIVHGMFPDGGIELIRYFYSKCNNELLNKLKNDTKNGESITHEPLEFLVQSVQTRLQMIEPYLSHWPQALAIMSLPQNVPKSLAQLLTLVDDICYYSGDRSVDFGWYTRRIGLATIYKMTELYMLQDSSINHEDTWSFLRKRMEEASNFESLIANTDGLTKNVEKKLISAFETARNILGLDYNRR